MRDPNMNLVERNPDVADADQDFSEQALNLVKDTSPHFTRSKAEHREPK